MVTNDAYRLETFIDVIPDELLPSFLKVVNSMGTDAPSAGFEAEELGVTEEKWRQCEKLLMKDGTESIFTLALHGHDVVGYTELVVKPGRPVGQGDTIVARDHRGHGLGMSMKARNLEVLSERHPHEEWVYTWNAGENAFMLHINDQIGFEIQNIGGLWQKKLNGSDSLE